MKISSIDCKVLQIPLKTPLTVATGVLKSADTVIVRLRTDQGLLGYGEASPVAFVTGETVPGAVSAIDALAPCLLGMDPFAISQIHENMDAALAYNTAAKAAVDMAVYDLQGKALNLPLYRLLGGTKKSVRTDVTLAIGSPEAMAAEARRRVSEGFTELKIKMGRAPAEDAAAIKAVREAVGGDIHLKVDANQGWNRKDALFMAGLLERFGVAVIEQPLPAGDLAGLRFLKERAGLPIMADESCFSPEDALRLIREDAADMLNIKLMKCGGIYPALKIADIAQIAGLSCMLGCMTESRLGTAAGLALASAHSAIRLADLDSTLFTCEHPALSGGYTENGPVRTLSELPGLGVNVIF